MESEIPVEARDFLTRFIVSVEQLEILFLIFQGRERDWSVAELNERIRSQDASIAKWLAILVTQQLVAAKDGRYRFAPADAGAEKQMSVTAAAYRDRRVKVIEFIFAKPNENLLSFARAFDLRKRP